jgi:hypothetical protein
VPDLSPAAIQAAAQALLATWVERKDPEETARLSDLARETARDVLAAAAPLIRAEALEQAAKAIEARTDGNPFDGSEIVSDEFEWNKVARFVRGLAEEGTKESA